MAGFDVDRFLDKPHRTPFLDVQTSSSRPRPSYSGDFFADDPQRGGTTTNVRSGVDAQFQTTGAIAGRRMSDVAGDAEYLMDSLGPNATDQEKEDLRRIIAAGGFDPEEGEGWLGKAFKGVVNAIDIGRKTIAAGVYDFFNIGEEFSQAGALRTIWDKAPGLGPLVTPPTSAEQTVGLDQWRTEDGEFWITGAQALRALGWDTEEADPETGEGENSLFNKIARGTVGFGVDFLMDPLSWVSFGTLGLGKHAAAAGARGAMASATRRAVTAITRGSFDDVADPLVRQMGDLLQKGGKGARESAYAVAERSEIKRRGIKRLSLDEETVLRNKVDNLWYEEAAAQAEIRAAGTDVATAAEHAGKKLDEGEEFSKLLSEGQGSPLDKMFSEVDRLVEAKQFRTLEDLFPDFIASDLVPAHSKGGLTITTPFMRKKMGGVNLGMRTDRDATKYVRQWAQEMWEHLPYDGIRSDISALWAKRGVEVAGAAFRRSAGAWTAEGVKGRAAHAVKMMGVVDAPGNLDVAVRQVAKVAKELGLDGQEQFSNLTRMLDEGWSPNFLKNQVPNLAMRETLEAAHDQVRGVLETLHRAMKSVGADIGTIEDYFPLVASKKFVKVLGTMADGELHESVARLIARATDDPTSLTTDQRNGLIIFDQFLTKMRQDATMAKQGISAIDKTAYQSARVTGKTAFSDLGGVDMAVLKRSEVVKLLSNTEVGWSSRATMNQAMKAALDLLNEAGAFGKRGVKGGLKDFDPLSMDLPQVLDSYVKAISRVVHMKTLIREGKRASLIGASNEVLEVGATLHELAKGPLTQANRRTLVAIADWVGTEGAVGAPKMRQIEIVAGWTVNLPEELAGDMRVVEAFKNLQLHGERAAARAGEHLAAMEGEVRNLVAEGIHAPIARDVALHTTDKYLVEAQAALFASLADEVATLRANTQALVASLGPEDSKVAIQAADDMAQQWVHQASETLEGLREQWRQKLGYERWSDDGYVDLLQPNEAGVMPFAPLVGKMEKEVDRLIQQRTSQIIDSNLQAELRAAATTGDMKLSIARALKNDVESNIIPNAVNEAWNDIADVVRMSGLTFDDVLKEVGPRKAVELVRKLTGFVEPETIDDALFDVAETFTEKWGRPYMPRMIDDVGDVRPIRQEYLSLPNVEAADLEVFETMYAETLEMYYALREAGYDITAGGTGRTPYATFGDRLKDISENRRLIVPTAPNPSEPKMFNEMIDGIPFGNLFDAVHQIMGHAVHGFDDSLEGVTQAWLAHGQMYSEGARDAFSSLTRGRRIAARTMPEDTTYVARRAALMPAEMIDMDIIAWQPKVAFSKLAMKDEYQEAVKLAKSLEARAGRISELESRSIQSYKMKPKVKAKKVVPEATGSGSRRVPNVPAEEVSGDRSFAINVADQVEGEPVVVRLKNGEIREFPDQAELDLWQAKHRMELRTEYENMTDMERRLAKEAPALRPRPARKFDINKMPIAERRRRMGEDLAALEQYQKEVRIYEHAVKRVTPEMRTAAEEELKEGWALVKDTGQLIENGLERRRKALNRALTAAETKQARKEIGAQAPLAPTRGYNDWLDLNRNSTSVDDILGTRQPVPPDLSIIQEDDLTAFPLFGTADEFTAWHDDVYTRTGDVGFFSDRKAADESLDVLRRPLAAEGDVYGAVSEDPFDFYKTLESQERQVTDVQFQGEIGEFKAKKKPEVGGSTPGHPAQVEITTVGKKNQVVLRGARTPEEAGAVMEDYMQQLKARWELMDGERARLYDLLAYEMQEVDLADLVGRQPIGMRGQGFGHEAFTDEAVQGMAGAAHKKLGAADGRQAARNVFDSTQRQAEILSENQSLRGLYDGKYLAPDTNLMSEMRRALLDGDATYLANHEADLRELLELIGFDPQRFVFEPRADGTYGMKYLTGTLEKVDPIVPESLRSELADWVPFSVHGMSTEDIIVKTNQLIDEGVLSYARFSEPVREFLQRVPDGKLPIEYEAMDYLRQLVPELTLAQGNLRRSLKRVAANEIDDAADGVSELLDMVEPFLRRRVGDEDGLNALWDAKRNLLERVLPQDAYHRLEGLVAVAPVVRKATAKARASLGKNSGRRWGKASEAYDAFDRAKAEATAILYKSGNDRADARSILESIEQLQDTLISFEPAFARGTKGSGSVDIGFEPSYRQAIPAVGEEAEEFVATVGQIGKEAAKAGKSVAKVASNESLQAHILREIPEARQAANIEDWIRQVGKDLANETKPIRRETSTATKRVKPAAVGIGGEDLMDMEVDTALAAILENMASHIQASFTPVGIRVMADQVRGFERYWKGAVTVGRPTFVPRNLLGGTFNNSIIDVGAREYFWLRNKALNLRRALDGGTSWDDAMKALSPEDADIFTKAREMRIFDAEFSSDIADPLLGRAAKRTINPAAGIAGGDKTFIGFDWGGKFMQSSEDWLRMAAFKRWYDPNNPQSALFAREMVFAVHFDYTSLTRMESRVKRFVPFFVWTRRNIPLQVQQLMENPGFYNRYMSIQRNVKTTFEDDEFSFADRNPIPGWMGSGTADLDTVTDSGDGLWTRWMFDPDLPTRDLEQLVDRFSGGNPLSNAMTWAKDMISPALSLPAEVASADDYFGNSKITAPTGMAGILKALDKVGLFWGQSKGGEPQISRGTRTLAESIFPFVKEWTEVAGMAPNDGMRAADLGYRLDDGVSMEERARGAFAGIGKAFGLRGTTPHDALQPVLEASRHIDAIEERAIGEGRLPMEGPQGAARENTGGAPEPGVYTSVEEASYYQNQAPEQGNMVIDGDTMKLQMPDGTYETVRLLGINTPESGELGANAATTFLERLLSSGGEVTMVRDKVDKDPYGRLLRYVWVGDKMVNLQLVEAGLANPQPYYPNRAFESLLDG